MQGQEGGGKTGRLEIRLKGESKFGNYIRGKKSQGVMEGEEKNNSWETREKGRKAWDLPEWGDTAGQSKGVGCNRKGEEGQREGDLGFRKSWSPAGKYEPKREVP